MSLLRYLKRKDGLPDPKASLTLELLGRFGRFLDEDDRHAALRSSHTFFDAPRALNRKFTVLP